MQYRTDERTGNELSVLGFGCMRLPRGITGIDYKKSEEMILHAIDKGVNYFDTAHMYSGSEETLGKVLTNNDLRDKIFLATKLPIVNCKKSEDFDRFFDEQLERLNTEHIDYYLMHNINTQNQWEELCRIGIADWIKAKRETGQIKQIGFSFHGSGDEFLKVIDSYDWDFCQIQYNYSNENYQAGVTGLKKAAEKKMPVIVMEPLLGGKLVTGLPKRAQEVFKQADSNISFAAWGLKWLLDQREVTVILSGMSNYEQVDDNLNTIETSKQNMLTEEEIKVYDDVIKIFSESYKIPCTGCGYCMPCPHNVNIPGCFAAYNSSFAMGKISGFMQYITSTNSNRTDHRTASQCKSCGKCEKFCPQHIEISSSLQDVKKRMEPFYFGMAMSLVRLYQK